MRKSCFFLRAKTTKILYLFVYLIQTKWKRRINNKTSSFSVSVKRRFKSFKMSIDNPKALKFLSYFFFVSVRLTCDSDTNNTTQVLYAYNHVHFPT